MPDLTLKEFSDKMNVAWEQLKTENDNRLKALEEGKGVALLDEKIDKLNKAIDDANAKFEQRLEELEKKDKEIKEPDQKPEDERIQARKSAFEKMLRKGDTALCDAEKKALTDYTPSEVKALAASDDTGGGYLAPEEFVREMIRTVTEFSPVRQFARVRPTSARASKWPKKTGTLTAQWVAEQGTRSETTGTAFGLIEIPNHEMYARVDVSQQDLEDSVFNLEQELRLEFGEQFAVAEGTAFITGTGVNQPQGIWTSSDVTKTATTGTSNTLATDDLIDCVYRLKEFYARNARWLFKRSQIGDIRKLQDGAGAYIWRAALADGSPATILGAPYSESPDLEDDGATLKKIGIYGDFRRGYVISDRVQIQVVRDPYTQAESGNVKFVARKRVGGQVVLGEALQAIKTPDS